MLLTNPNFVSRGEYPEVKVPPASTDFLGAGDPSLFLNRRFATGVQVTALLEPAESSLYCADFCRSHELDDGSALVVLGDPTGHGLESESLSQLAQEAITEACRACSGELVREGKAGLRVLLDYVNERVYEATSSTFELAGSFLALTAVLIRPLSFDDDNGTPRFSVLYGAAGNPHPILQEHPLGNFAELPYPGLLLGVESGNGAGTVFERPVDAGARLVLFSDGATEALAPSENLLTASSSIARMAGHEALSLFGHLSSAVRVDDSSVVCIACGEASAGNNRARMVA